MYFKLQIKKLQNLVNVGKTSISILLILLRLPLRIQLIKILPRSEEGSVDVVEEILEVVHLLTIAFNPKFAYFSEVHIFEYFVPFIGSSRTDLNNQINLILQFNSIFFKAKFFTFVESYLIAFGA